MRRYLFTAPWEFRALPWFFHNCPAVMPGDRPLPSRQHGDRHKASDPPPTSYFSQQPDLPRMSAQDVALYYDELHRWTAKDKDFQVFSGARTTPSIVS